MAQGPIWPLGVATMALIVAAMIFYVSSSRQLARPYFPSSLIIIVRASS